MKALILSLALGLGLLIGCAAPDVDEANTQEEQENVAAQSDELISTGGLGWSADCKKCKDACDADYPGGGGPLQTCKKLCVLAGTCTKTTGPGIIFMR